MNKLILFALIFAVLLVDTDAWGRRPLGHFIHVVKKLDNKAWKWPVHVQKWARHVSRSDAISRDNSPEDMIEQELMDLKKNEEFVQLMHDMEMDAMMMNEEMATDDDDVDLVQLLEE